MKILSAIFPKRRRYPSMWHELADFFRIAVIALSAAVLLCSLVVPLTAAAYLLFAAQFILACALKRGISRRLRAGLLGAALVIVPIALQIRKVSISSGSQIIFTSIPNAPPASPSWIVKEEDGIYPSFKLLSLLRGLTARESAGLQEVMEREYAVMRSEYGDFPTPLGSTFLGTERAASFDLLSFPAQGERAEDTNNRKALIFLHGTGGNWSILCWAVAGAVRPLGYATFCPSTGPLGLWDADDGIEIFEATLREVEARHYKRIFLAGISAGAVGAVTIAGKHRDDLAGLILISGLRPGVKGSGLDTLLITGRGDERFTPGVVEWLLRQDPGSGERLEHHWIESDHTAILKKKSEIQAVIRDWMQRTERAKTRDSVSHLLDEPLAVEVP